MRYRVVTVLRETGQEVATVVRNIPTEELAQAYAKYIRQAALIKNPAIRYEVRPS